MAFQFGNIRTTQTKKDLEVETLESPLQGLYKPTALTTTTLPFVMGEHLPASFERLFPQIKTWLEETIALYSPVPHTGFSLFNSLSTKASTVTQPIEKEITTTYIRNSWPIEMFREEVDKQSPNCPFVFAVGRGLYSLTRSDELQTSFFYDIVFNKSFFYAPDIDRFVFPIDNFSSILRKVKTNLNAKSSYDQYIYQKVNLGVDRNTIVADAASTNFTLFQLQYALSHWSELQEELEKIRARPKLTYTISTSEDHSASLLEEILSDKSAEVAYDLETSGLDFMSNEIGDLTLAISPTHGIYIPWVHVAQSVKCMRLFAEINETKKIIGANLKFDLKFIRRACHNIGGEWLRLEKAVKVDYDVIQCGHVLNEARFNSLKTLTWLYTPYGGYNRPLDEYLKTHPWIDNYLNIPDNVRIPYAANDPAVTYFVHQEEMKQLASIAHNQDREDDVNHTMEEFYSEMMMPVTNMFSDIEYEGLYIDIEKMRDNERFVREQLEVLEEEIRAEFIKELNVASLPPFDLSSPTQLGRFLEETMGWPDVGRNKAKVYATGDDQLVKWINLGYEVAKKIQNYRSWSVALKTFIGNPEEKTGWWQYVRFHPEDNSYRIHADFIAMRAESMRNRCNHPNLQNIPARGVIAKRIKGVIAPPSPDFYIASIDFDSFQLKIGTIHSGDETLRALYTDPSNKIDLHTLTAHKIFGQRLYDVPYIEFEDEKGKMHRVLEKEFVTVYRNKGDEAEQMLARDYIKDVREGDRVSIPD